MITQTTGEDWTDTKIFLSTASPSIGGNVPEITTENVRIKPTYSYKKSKKMMQSFSSPKCESDVLYDSYETKVCSLSAAPPQLRYQEAQVTQISCDKIVRHSI